MSTAPSPAAAEAYATRGYFVFPLRPRTKDPYGKTRGLLDATSDVRAVLHLWDRYGAGSNIGASPAPSGAFIFDIDSKGGADPEDVLTELELDLRDLVIVWTGTAGEPDRQHPNSLSGVRGAHVWFKGSAPTGKVSSLAGCEFRGIGAYGLLPPSIHPCGDRYEGALPPAAALPDPPACILELIGTVESVAVSVEDGVAFESPGRHEHLLAWGRSRYTANGVLGEAALLGMLKKNEVACRPPLPDDEVKRLWRHLERTRIAARSHAITEFAKRWSTREKRS